MCTFTGNLTKNLTLVRYVLQVNVADQIIYEAVCPPPAGTRVTPGKPRSHCPVSDRQFLVAGAG